MHNPTASSDKEGKPRTSAFGRCPLYMECAIAPGEILAHAPLMNTYSQVVRVQVRCVPIMAAGHPSFEHLPGRAAAAEPGRARHTCGCPSSALVLTTSGEPRLRHAASANCYPWERCLMLKEHVASIETEAAQVGDTRGLQQQTRSGARVRSRT